MAANRSGSILAADFGSVYTRVVLIDLVDGIYRLVMQGAARTTVGHPFDDVGVGLDRALRNLHDQTGREFMGEDGKIIRPEQPDRSGVDYFLATASTGQPMQTVLVGLVPDLSIASGIRAASGTYMQVTEVISLDDGRDEEERLNAILLGRPDLIFITGGTDAGAQKAVLELAKVVRLAVTLIDEKNRPVVVFAGNNDLAESVSALFEGVTTLLVAGNVRPDLEGEHLESAQLQLGGAFDEYKEHQGSGFGAISSMSQVGILPSAQGYGLLAEYLGKMNAGNNVLLVDVGSAASTVATSIKGQVVTSISTEIGLGHSANTLLQEVGLEAIRRWIPFYVTPVQVVNYALNKMLHPATIPMTLDDVYLEHALLRAGIQQLVESVRPQWSEDKPDFDMLIGAGSGLTGTGNKGYTAMLLLDALQPEGVTELYADPFGLIAALGAMALTVPAAVVQLIDEHGLDRLGTSISVGGTPTPGKPALQAKFTIEGEKFEYDVEGGHLLVLPLGIGKKLNLELKVLGRGLHIGGKRRLKLTVEGGTAGLILDARGRPLPLAANPVERAEQMPLWVSQATGDPLLEIDERWLVQVAPEAEGVKDATASLREKVPAKKRRGLFGGRQKKEKAQEPSLDDRLSTLEIKRAALNDADDFDDLLDEDFDDDELRDLRDELSS